MGFNSGFKGLNRKPTRSLVYLSNPWSLTVGYFIVQKLAGPIGLLHPICREGSYARSREAVQSFVQWEHHCNTMCFGGLYILNTKPTSNVCRSQWPRGLRHRSAASRLLRSWVRIPPGAWIFVCFEYCVLSGRGLCDELITRPEESYRLWCVVVCDLETS